MRENDLLDLVLSSLGEQVAVLDRDGTIIATNTGWNEVLNSSGGRKSHCGIGANYLKVCRSVSGIDREEANSAANSIESVLSGKNPGANLEYFCETPTGLSRYLMTVKSLNSPGGGVIVSHRNLFHEKDQDIETCRENLHLRGDIIDEVPALISYVDNDRRYRLVNRMYSEWFGRSREEIEGKAVREILGDTAYEALLPEIDAVLSGETINFERLLNYVDGGERFVRGSLIPDISDTGEVRGYFALLTDDTLRHEMEMRLRRSEERFSKLFNFIPLSITISSLKDQRYVEANETFLQSTGRQREDVIGRSGPELGIGMPEDQRQRFSEILMSEGRVSNFEAQITTVDKPERTVLLSAVILQIAGESFLAASGYDITDRKRAENSLRELTSKMLNLQEEERRRLARELHDTTAQKLSAQLLTLSYLKKLLTKSNSEVTDSLAESIAYAEEALGEIRTFSYVLHPPLLDKAGLPSALRWLADGFMKRSGIRVEFASAGLERRLPEEMEGAIFRIVQEALTNIQRHSQSKSAVIVLEQSSKHVRLEVRDEGIGFGDERNISGPLSLEETEGLGVGILSMRERIRQFGGELAIYTGPSGTKIIAEIPIK